MGPTRQAMKDAGLSNADIDEVILVGGSTRIPAVQEAIKKKLVKNQTKVLTLMKLLRWVQQSKVGLSLVMLKMLYY